ncbi:MAG TPA: hypothetical protein VIW69_11815 [Candidatus Elarobacter sp.]
MSLSSLGADAATRKKAALIIDGRQANPHAAAAKDALDQEKDALSTLALFIPAETIAIYVTVGAVLVKTFASASDQAAWWWYGINVALSVVFTWVAFAITWRKNNRGAYPAWQAVPRFRLVAAAVAFASWGLAISPAMSNAMFCHPTSTACTDYANALAGALVIVVAVVLAMLDRLVNYDDPIVTKAKPAPGAPAGGTQPTDIATPPSTVTNPH